MRLLGAVLAGGQSRRFGSDKAVALLDGVSLLEHAVSQLREVTDEIVVCGHTSTIAGATSIADRPHPGLGPLGGLCAALCYAADGEFDAVVSLGCDTPIVPRALLTKLAAADDAACLRDLPIIGRWPVTLSGLLTRRLEEDDDRSVYAFAAAAEAHFVDVDVAIPNFNRPTDLARLGKPLAPKG